MTVEERMHAEQALGGAEHFLSFWFDNHDQDNLAEKDFQSRELKAAGATLKELIDHLQLPHQLVLTVGSRAVQAYHFNSDAYNSEPLEAESLQSGDKLVIAEHRSILNSSTSDRGEVTFFGSERKITLPGLAVALCADGDFDLVEFSPVH